MLRNVCTDQERLYSKESLSTCVQGWLGLLCDFIHHSTYLILQVQVGSSPHQLHHHISSTQPGCLNEGSVSILCSDRQCVGTNIHYMEQARRLWHTVGTTQRWMKGIYVHVWISQQRTLFCGYLEHLSEKEEREERRERVNILAVPLYTV